MNRYTVTYDELSGAGRAGAPSVLITVRSVEDPPSLRYCRSRSTWKASEQRKGSRTYECSGVLSHKISHWDYRLHTRRGLCKQAVPDATGCEEGAIPFQLSRVRGRRWQPTRVWRLAPPWWDGWRARERSRSDRRYRCRSTRGAAEIKIMGALSVNAAAIEGTAT